MAIDVSAIKWWWIPLIFVVYQVTAYVGYLYKFKKSGAKKAYFFDDKWYGFWFTKEVWFRRQRGEMVHLFPELFEQTGKDTINLRIAGDTWYATREPENMKAILSSQFNDFSLGLRNRQFRILLGDGIFTLDGAGWKHSRAMLRPQFAKEQVSHVPMLEPHVQQVIRRVKAANGAKFDIQPLFFKLTIDSATEFLFGESCCSLQDDIVDYSQLAGPPEMAEFPSSFNTSQEYLLLRTGFQQFYFLITSAEFRRCNKVVHRFTDHYVRKALDASPEELTKRTDASYVFLYELAKQTKDPRVLRDQCLNILIAARDTTAGLMAFLFFELARNPQIFQRLRSEIVTAFGEGDNADLSKMTFESLKKLEYLKWVINEALRLYPSVPQNARVATKDTTLPRGGGPNGNDPIFVHKGQVVAYSVLSTHRNPAIYGPDALVFRPERWADPAIKKVGWGYLPFNGGPRICLGQQFALTEASYVTARLLQAFKNIESFDGPEDPKKHTHLTMSLHGGANIRLY